MFKKVNGVKHLGMEGVYVLWDIGFLGSLTTYIDLFFLMCHHFFLCTPSVSKCLTPLTF